MSIYTAQGYQKVNQIIEQGGGSLLIEKSNSTPPAHTSGSFMFTSIWAKELSSIEEDLKRTYEDDENVTIGSAYEYENGYIIEISVD